MLQSEEEKAVLAEELQRLRNWQKTEHSQIADENQTLSVRIAALSEELQSSKSALAQKESALQRLAEEQSHLNEELTYERNLKKSLTEDLESVRHDNEQMQNELENLKKEMSSIKIEENEREKAADMRMRSQLASKVGLTDEWRLRETRLEIATLRAETDGLRESNQALQRDLEASVRDTSLFGDSLMHCRLQYDTCREKLVAAEEAKRHADSQLIAVESENRKLISKNRDLEAVLLQKEADYRDLQRRTDSLKEDLDFMLKAKSVSPNATPSLSPYPHSSRRNKWQEKITSQNYLNSNSTDNSEEGDGQTEQKAVDHEREPFPVSFLQRKSSQKRNSDDYLDQAGPPVPLSALERSAAETVGHILYEEATENLSSKGFDFQLLREACAKAALRLLSSTADYARKTAVAKADGQTEIENFHVHPLYQLGKKDFLSKIVTETQVCMSAIEEAKLMKQEVRQFKV